MERGQDWLDRLMPDSGRKCFLYFVFAALAIWESVEIFVTHQLTVGRPGGRFAILEGPSAMVAGVLFVLAATVLIFLGVRYLREMKH